MSKLEAAKQLMEEFARRTGLEGGANGNIKRRYLWTDAFAVQTFFGLAKGTGDEGYKDLALKLVDQVHSTLGRFREDDRRTGWISGLSEEEGSQHPTINGLRIGKPQPERTPQDQYDEDDEWDRDGQYMHYITRWIQALIQTFQETGNKKYAIWAAELIQASHKFVDKSGSRPHMYWKLNTDLSKPAVPFMGAHDPLEGAMLARTAKLVVPEKSSQLDEFIRDMDCLCQRHDWSTPDPLGLGGLLLNVPRSLELESAGILLPPELQTKKLYEDACVGLQQYRWSMSPNKPASRRLAFRECGLSLGLRVMDDLKNHCACSTLAFDEIPQYIPLADTIERFWTQSDNQRSPTWEDHLDINAVMLAASLTAAHSPDTASVFSVPKKQ